MVGWRRHLIDAQPVLEVFFVFSTQGERLFFQIHFFVIYYCEYVWIFQIHIIVFAHRMKTIYVHYHRFRDSEK